MSRCRPILFTGPMVCAVLQGRKTHTRRLVKPQPPDFWQTVEVGHYHPTIIDRYGEQQPGAEVFGAYDLDGEWGCPSPYGEPGDLLWVRETWRTGVALDKHNATQIAESADEAGYTKPWAPLLYNARPHGHEHASVNADTLGSFGGAWGRVRAARFMPRWASRITLRVRSVRVERLHAMTETDAVAEGFSDLNQSALTMFKFAWEDMHDVRWEDANPWVWDIGFERVDDDEVPF
ncbi:MAG TPA: hypothetical protein VFG69_15250 [Nannocystaceae bacterium]|nr:hypothetical protein [Nannocystaceae bacterium]